MALILNEDEEQFRQSVRRLVAKRSPLPTLRELMSSGRPFDAEVWKQLSALGLTGLIIGVYYLHLFAGNLFTGWVGGFLPAVAYAMVTASGDIYFGLWYPIVIAGVTAIIGLLFVPETKDRDIYAGDSSVHPGDTVLEFDPNAADY